MSFVSRRHWDHTQLIIFQLAIAAALSLLIGTVCYLFITLDIPDLTTLAEYRPFTTTVILDHEDNMVDAVYKENRYIISLEQMPELLPKAFVAAEDGRFYEHAGVDFWSVLRALYHNLRSGERSQGGSTITQQVARSLLLSPEKTYTRKIKEAILAYRIDKYLEKQDILFIYLNQIYLGEGAYGVEAAARNYFGKHAADLNLAEISMLAGLPQAPSRYSPIKHYKLARKRQVYVLNRMAEVGFISPTAARKSYQHLLQFRSAESTETGNEFFVQKVKKLVEQKYGAALLSTGGLTIHTSLDQKLQAAANRSVRHGLAEWQRRQHPTGSSKPPQAALLAMNIKNGQVMAVTGGANFAQSQFNRATQALRQPGSAFKPIIYATALANGFTPATLIDDEPLQLQGIMPGDLWEPKNFDGTYWGPTTLRNGLVFSRNIVTIKILQSLSIPKVLKTARNLGINSALSSNLSLALGSSEVSLLDLTAAYAVFARGGKYMEPIFITSIIDSSGQIIEENSPSSRPAIDARTAYQITHLLKQAVQDGTGKKARGLPIETAGKTGTTDKNMDAWFIGYTPDLAVGVWMGYDQKISLGMSETGGKVAAPIWLDFMEDASSYCVTEKFSQPDGITLVPMDAETGEIVIGETRNITWEAFRNDNIPTPKIKFEDNTESNNYTQ